MRKFLCFLPVLIILSGCDRIREGSEMPIGELKADLQTLAESRVFFGHQSVGRDIIQGLESLAGEAGVNLRIVDVTKSADDSLPGLYHANVGVNRKPGTKCEAFAGHLSQPGAPAYDAALLKFCYVDLGDGAIGEPSELLGLYAKMLESLKKARPDIRIIHATVPLKSDPLSLKGSVKRILGLETHNDADNLKRNLFNELLAAEYGKEPFFDLARAQSTLPDGRRSGFTRNGRTIFTMDRNYTYDEGHLTAEGQKWVAREFVRVVAEALRGSRSRVAGAGAPQ